MECDVVDIFRHFSIYEYPWNERRRVPSIAVNVFRLNFHKLALFAGNDSTAKNLVPIFAKKCGKKALAASWIAGTSNMRGVIVGKHIYFPFLFLFWL